MEGSDNMKPAPEPTAETRPTLGDEEQTGEGAQDQEEAASSDLRDQTVAITEKLALSVEEAGALLGISRDLAYDLVARRELPSIRLGRRLVVPRRALEEALDRLVEAS